MQFRKPNMLLDAKTVQQFERFLAIQDDRQDKHMPNRRIQQQSERLNRRKRRLFRRVRAKRRKPITDKTRVVVKSFKGRHIFRARISSYLHLSASI